MTFINITFISIQYIFYTTTLHLIYMQIKDIIQKHILTLKSMGDFPDNDSSIYT